MFEPGVGLRVFGVAPGVDFPKALHDGLLHRTSGLAPEALARVQLIVNTARMERRIKALFDSGPARLLPRISLLTHMDRLDPSVAQPAAISPLRRRLELISLVAQLVDQQPELAPRSSIYALTDSLASLMDEMQGEGVSAETVCTLDVSDQSGHWQRAQTFISIAQDYLTKTAPAPDKEARQRQMVLALADRWATAPPEHPVILAGSTGSRGTTLLLMEAIARLPQGAVILPGFDFDLPGAQWLQLQDQMLSEDHPQYRFFKLMARMGIGHRDIVPWHDIQPPSPARNRLISLSLRPAPFTYAWLSEGPRLTGLDAATADMTLLEAPNPRTEALTIALRLRQAVEQGQKAAVISPDRMLTRQITATLDQWDILPDDSAGSPLHLSPPGRFLRHVSALFHRKLDAEALLTLLKHPLTHSSTDRGHHILNTQRLELEIRRHGLPYPDAQSIAALMQKAVTSPKEQAAALKWAAWVGQTFCGCETLSEQPLGAWVQQHLTCAEAISTGPDGPDEGELWQKNAGQKARLVMSRLEENAPYGPAMTAADYDSLVGALLADEEVRDRDAPHQDVMIWGTLEARVQGADLVILAGLNEGTWPEAPDPDPWLNRALRHKAGLLLPERRIGLSAHDYQQAVAAPEVWITRAIRSEDAETVASRWVNRLCNLLDGLPAQKGPAVLAGMRARGGEWLSKARAFEEVIPAAPAKRPSPRPPTAARPRRLAVTDIKHLIRDPYAIYAKHVLGLRPLGALLQSPDALSRGTVLHDVMERFVRATRDDPENLKASALMDMAQGLLENDVPWPTARALWLARLNRIAPEFVQREADRQARATPRAFEAEAKGKLDWPDLDFSLIGRADRIDQTTAGDVLLYDYKTGSVPTTAEQIKFDKQLLIEAAMVEEGAFENIGSRSVLEAVFISLGSKMVEQPAPLADEPAHKVLTELRQLIESYLSPTQGFSARRMMKKNSFASDYDQLARYGEWDITDPADPEDLT